MNRVAAIVTLSPILALALMACDLDLFPPADAQAHIWALMIVPDPQAACVGDYAVKEYDGVRLDDAEDIDGLYLSLDEPELIQVYAQAATTTCDFDPTSLGGQSKWASWSSGVVRAMDGGLALSRPAWTQETRWCVAANLVRDHTPEELQGMSEEARGDVGDALYQGCADIKP